MSVKTALYFPFFSLKVRTTVPDLETVYCSTPSFLPSRIAILSTTTFKLFLSLTSIQLEVGLSMFMITCWFAPETGTVTTALGVTTGDFQI